MISRNRCVMLASVALVVAVVGYNVWSYSCGRCTIRAFMTLGPAGLLLLPLNAVAALLLFWLRLRSRQRRRRQLCTCGTLRGTGWSFCPNCGAAAE